MLQSGQRVWSKVYTPSVEPAKGVLMSEVITDLRIALTYEVGLTSISNYGTGDPVVRMVQFAERKFLLFVAPSPK